MQKNLKADLINVFKLLGIEGALILEGGKIGIRKDVVDCDYYAYLDGNKELFRGGQFLRPRGTMS